MLVSDIMDRHYLIHNTPFIIQVFNSLIYLKHNQDNAGYFRNTLFTSFPCTCFNWECLLYNTFKICLKIRLIFFVLDLLLQTMLLLLYFFYS